MIRRIEKEDLPACLEVVRASFQTVADEFGLTEDNCPGHTAFTKIERLERDFELGNLMFGYFKDGLCIGFVALRNKPEDPDCEMNQLCVLPQYRHLGVGRELVMHAARTAASLWHKKKLKIGIIDESAVLKAWYESLGFIQTGTQKFDHLPFTVGFLEMVL